MDSSHVAPIITLTTDFGLADHYVGTMKGVLLSRCPDARLIDISHDVPPFSIYSGAYTIDQAAPYFPPGAIHLIVIDPGVGTERKPLLVESGEQYFIAPDNGVLSMVVARNGVPKVREIANRSLWLDSPSSTFHGRDVFAPVAAALASGAASPAEVGPLLPRIELLPDLEPKQTQDGVWKGKLLAVDRFGNAVTNFKTGTFARIVTGSFALSIGDHKITDFRRTFGIAPSGLCFAYIGSSGYIEVAANQQSAAKLLNASPGDYITLRF